MPKAIVTANEIAVRDKPASSSGLITYLHKGDEVEVIGDINEKYAQIVIPGYAYSDGGKHIKLIDDSQPIETPAPISGKVKISEFLAYFEPHAVMTNGHAPDPPPAHQWGYVMGGDGRTATDAYLRHRAKSSYPDSWESHYRDTLKWLGRPVFDCNAAAEAYYRKRTGKNIDTKARLNYANWCSVKSNSRPDANLTGLPQMSGVAVFSGGSSASGITHVGYLLKKYGEGPLDWYVLEFRGRNYGCVITKLKDRSWRYWGVMSKYFEYDVDTVPVVEIEPTVARLLKNTDKPYMSGLDVEAVQRALEAAGYDVGKIDGVYGPKTEAAVIAFQRDRGLEADGIVGPKTCAALGIKWVG